MSVYIGRKYNKWTVLDVAVSKFTKFKCVCECGTIRDVFLSNLSGGLSKSCGCKSYDSKYGDLRKREPVLMSLWESIKNRCYNRKSPSYKNYGGRGIILYHGWSDSPEEFVDYIKSNLGHRPSPEHSLDRIDNNIGYEPRNLRWADYYTQMSNTRNSDILTPSKLASLTGYSREYIRQLCSVSNTKCNNSMLLPYIKEIYKSGKIIKIIFYDSAIEFLRKKKKQ